MSNKATVLFGGSGFLGPVILEKYPHIISVGRTPPPSYIKNKHIQLDSLDDMSVLDNVDFDKVIFLVGNSNHHEINHSSSMGIDFNVTPLQKAMAYFQKRKLQKLICFTSILLYDVNKMVNPVSENQPLSPYINEYVFSKYLSEEVVRFYQNKVPTIIIRCSNIYGATKLVRPDLVPTLIQKVLSPHDVSVWNKQPVRDFIYLEDAADALIKLLDCDYVGPVNLGTGESVSIGQIADILEKVSGKKIHDRKMPVSGPMNFQCDVTLLKKLTGFKPQFSLEQGVLATYGRMKNWADECRWWDTHQLL